MTMPVDVSKMGGRTVPRKGNPLVLWNGWREQHNPLRGLTMERAIRLVESYPRGEYADLMWTLGAPFVGIEAADADLCAIIGRRADALYEMDWNAKVMSGDRVDGVLADEQAAWIHEMMEGIDGLEDVVEHLSLAACRGFSLVEIVPKWTVMGVELMPVDHWNVVRDGLRGDWFYNPEARQTGASGLGEGMRLDGGRFLIREVKRPFGRMALAKFVRGNLAERDWSAFAEIYGLPSGVVTMPPDVPEGREAMYEAAACAIAEAGSGSLPYGADYKPNPAVAGKSGAPFRDFLDYLTEKLVLVGTGGKLTMLAESGSGTLAGGAHADVWRQLARAEAVRISRVVQAQLVVPLLRMAWPDRPVSAYWELAYREEVAGSEVIEDALKLSGAGYRMKLESLAEKTGYELVDGDGMAGGGVEPRRSSANASELRNRANGAEDDSERSGAILEGFAKMGDVSKFAGLSERLYGVIYGELIGAVQDEFSGVANPLQIVANRSEGRNRVNGAECGSERSGAILEGFAEIESPGAVGWLMGEVRNVDKDGREGVWRFVKGHRVFIAAKPGRAVRVDSITEVLSAAKSNAKAYANWGAADQTDADVAMDAFGIDVNGFKRVVAADEVRKNLGKHGTDAIPVTEADFAALPELIARRQRVVASIRPRREPRLISLVPDGDTTVIVEEVRKGRKKLALVSIRKMPGTDLEKIIRTLRAIHNREAGSVAQTPEAGADRSSFAIYNAKGIKIKR